MNPFTRHLAALMFAVAFSDSPVVAAPDDYDQCALKKEKIATVTGAEREQSTAYIWAAQINTLEQATYVLEGDVEFQRADQSLFTQRLIFHQNERVAELQNGLEYNDSDIHLRAASGRINMAENSSHMQQLDYRLQAGRGRGHAATAERRSSGETAMESFSFTTCEPDDVAWKLVAEKVELDHKKGRGKARNATFYFKGVPFFYTPYASFPLDERRKSGFLSPAFQFSDRNGLDYSQPYYFNLAANRDLILTTRLLQDRGAMIGTEFRFLGQRQNGEINMTYLADDDKTDTSRYSYRIVHRSRFSARWSSYLSLNDVSDTEFRRDFGNNLEYTATSFLRSIGQITGNGDNWAFAIAFDRFNLLTDSITEAGLPYRREPSVSYSTSTDRGPQWLEAGIVANWTRFDKSTGVTGSRTDMRPWISARVDKAAYFAESRLAYRYTSYALNDADDSAPARSLPIASVDLGTYFDRSLSIKGGGYSQSLEPRLYYLYVPFEEQSQLPDFDTANLDFSFSSLFFDNRFSGADRQADANQLTFALSTSITEDETGEQILSAKIGQIFYFDTQKVQLGNKPEIDQSNSSIAAEISISPFYRWTISSAVQWNPQDGDTEKFTFRVQRKFAGHGVFNIAYRFRQQSLEQIDSSIVWPINAKWRVMGRLNYSLLEDENLESLAGIEYQSCCWSSRLVFRKYAFEDNGVTNQNSSLYFQIELKGLGALGRNSEQFLQRSIRGYTHESF